MADNVRAALALVARGEAVLGIVYETDAKVEPKREDRRRLPGRLASADRLSGRRDGRTPSPRRRPTSRSCAAASPRRCSSNTASRSWCGRRPNRAVLVFSLTPDEWTAVLLSLRIAVVATVVALPFGIAIAWLLARKDFWGKALLDGLVHLPLVLPPVVTGYLLLIWFGRRGVIGAFLADTFGIVFSFRWTGAALACGVMGFPLLVRAIRLSFEAVDAKLEDAAWTLGANPLAACSPP